MAISRNITVLFTSAGRRVELANCFRHDAGVLDVSLRVLAVDLSPENSAACQSAHDSWRVPRCTSTDYIRVLLEICLRERVNLLIPTIDTELKILATHRDEFEAIGTRVAVSSPETIDLARDKLATACLLSCHGLPVPRTESLLEFLANSGDWRWPVMLKPIDGSCSFGIYVVNTKEDLRNLDYYNGDYIAQEFRKGREYTVNMFFDREGKLRCAVPHERLETRAGEVSKGVTERNPQVHDLAQRFGNVLPGAYGALCFQLILDEEGPWIFELNARFGGGYPVAHQAGGRFSKWLLEECLDRQPTFDDNWTDGVKMLRYDAAVFTRENS